MIDELSASEALYGFAGWLTSRSERTVMSGADEAGIVADLVYEFCKVNQLADPREGWAKILVHPKEKHKTTRKDTKVTIQKNLLKMPEFWTLVANLVFSNVLYFSTKYMSPELAMDVKFFVDSVQPLIVFVVGLLGAARIAAMVVYAVKDPEYRARFVEKFAK